MCPYHHSVKRNVILGKRGTSVLRESWGLVLAEKLEFCIMEAIEFKFEERLVTKAVGLPQEGFDLVVDAFHPAVVDAVLPPVQDSTSMDGESFGQLLHSNHAALVSVQHGCGGSPLRAKIAAEPGGKLSRRRPSAVAPKGSALLLELPWGEKPSRGAFGARRQGEARDSPCFCAINP